MLCIPVYHVSNRCRWFDFVFNSRPSAPNPIVICHPNSFSKVERISSDIQSYFCFLYLSHIDCNVGPFENIPTEHPMFITSMCLICIPFSCEYNAENGNRTRISILYHKVFIVIYCCMHLTSHRIHSCLQHDSEMKCDIYNVQILWEKHNVHSWYIICISPRYLLDFIYVCIFSTVLSEPFILSQESYELSEKYFHFETYLWQIRIIILILLSMSHFSFDQCQHSCCKLRQLFFCNWTSSMHGQLIIHIL